MLRFLPLALLLAPVAAAAQVPNDADQLAEQVRRLGANPQDLDALLTAGELSVRLEDISAAAAFFARAEKIDARNGRAKAGEAALLVHSERPAESLRLFAQAEALGLPVARLAGERGLAYDLLGDPVRAQRDYQAALTARDDPEVRRRYALSLAIAGRQAPALAELDPLIRQNDRAAWRSRAFVLAMAGDTSGATRIAETMMPPGAATALQGFFTQLPRLSATDKAFAVHFGEVQATPQRLADARLPHEAALPVPALVVAAAPVAAPTNDRRGKRDRKRRGEQQVAVALPPPAALPPPPAYQAPVYQPPAAATPLRDRPPGTGAQVAMGAGGGRSRPGRARPTYAAPAVTPALTPDEARSLAAAGGARDGTTSRLPDPVRRAPAVVVASRVPTIAPNISGSAGAVPVAAAPPAVVTIAAAPTVTATTDVPARPAYVTPVVTRPLTAQEQASLLAATGPAPRPAVVAPAPGFSAASGVEVAAAVPTPSPVAPPVPRISRRQQYARADTVLSRIVAGLSVPAAELDVASAAPSAAQRRAAERKATAAAKMLADKKAAAEAKVEADRQATEDRRAARADPARIWVQVGGGANEAALALSWRTIKAKAPQAFAGRQGWTTPLRATNRILAGPFKSNEEARAFVNQLARAGVQAFAFSSDAGQKVTRLSAD